MNYYIVKENSNWADEFDLEGFKLFKSESEEDLKLKIIGNMQFPIELSFGTNEDQVYSSSEELLNDLSIKELEESDYNFILDLFPNSHIYSFGTTAIL